jgi:CheY-like chemotaxis protein
MQDMKLEEARVLLVDSQAHTRGLLSDALWKIGFSKIEEVAEIDDLKQAIEFVEPDLVLIDVDENREFVCDAIKDIRNRKLGNNPFVAIVALTWKSAKDAVGDVLSAGVDDIVMKPVSPTILRERVTALIEDRKDFVVTADYVGPDRRATKRPPSANDLPMVKVPNSLRYVAMHDESASINPDVVAETVRSLCAQKIYRLASEIGEIAAGLHVQCTVVPEAPLPKVALGKVEQMLGQIEEIIGEHRFESVSQIAKSTRVILDGIAATHPTADRRQVEILHLHGQAIAVTLKESDESAGVLVSALSEAAMVVNG